MLDPTSAALTAARSCTSMSRERRHVAATRVSQSYLRTSIWRRRQSKGHAAMALINAAAKDGGYLRPVRAGGEHLGVANFVCRVVGQKQKKRSHFFRHTHTPHSGREPLAVV